MEQTNGRHERIQWIDGLRGIACLAIFAHHFMCCFYPNFYFAPKPYAQKWVVAFGQNPISVLVNGNYWVCVFCMMTGFVAALPILKQRGRFFLGWEQSLANSLLKRYFRLFLPVFWASAVVFLLLKTGATTNILFAWMTDSEWAYLVYSAYHESSTVITLLIDSFIRVPFLGSTMYNEAYWMLPHVFYGYFFSVILAEMSWYKGKMLPVVYLAFASGLLMAGLHLTACFPVGVFLAWKWYASQDTSAVSGSRSRETLKRIMTSVFMVTGLLLGGFPSLYLAQDGIYQRLNISLLEAEPYMISHVVGAALFLLGIEQSKYTQRTLARKTLLWLGKNSYSLYLIHVAVIATIGTGVALHLLQKTELQYNWVAMLSFAATLAVLLPLSAVFQRFVEQPCEKVAAKIFLNNCPGDQ